MNQSLILFLTLFSSLSVSTTNAWTMPGRRAIRTPASSSLTPQRFRKSSQSKSSDTERHFRNGVEDDEPTTTTMTTTPSLQSSAVRFSDGGSATMILDTNIINSSTMPVVPQSPTTSQQEEELPTLRTIDLPRHSPPTNTVRNAKMMWDLELILGRTAMVAGFFMLVGEVFFGVSPLVS